MTNEIQQAIERLRHSAGGATCVIPAGPVGQNRSFNTVRLCPELIALMEAAFDLSGRCEICHEIPCDPFCPLLLLAQKINGEPTAA